jgi:hypothetical protein
MPGAIAETIGTPTPQPLHDQQLVGRVNKRVLVAEKPTCWGSLPHPNLHFCSYAAPQRQI